MVVLSGITLLLNIAQRPRAASIYLLSVGTLHLALLPILLIPPDFFYKYTHIVRCAGLMWCWWW